MTDENEDMDRELRRILVWYPVAHLRRYVDTLESALAHIKGEADTIYREAAEADPTSDEKNYLDYLAEERATHVNRDVPFMVWSSAFMTIFSLFETTATELAQERHAKRNGGVHLKPKFAKRFQKLAAAIDDLKKDVPDLKGSAAWQEIDQYREIRNMIAHRRGHLVLFDPDEQVDLDNQPESDEIREIRNDVARSKKIATYIKRRKKSNKSGLELANGLIVIKSEFCREALSTIHECLGELVAKLPN
jgi:hypothetical protein